VIERYSSVCDSGGAGRHRGGNGIEKIYRFEAPGEVTIQDDRSESRPWGVEGGQEGATSRKELIRRDGSRETLPSKIDLVRVDKGDRLVFVTAGAGGLGDPSERDAEATRQDVRRGLVSRKAAAEIYGIEEESE